MKAYLCDCCKKAIDMNKKDCVTIKVSFGRRAIESGGQYGDGFTADICEECFTDKILPLIDHKHGNDGNYFLLNRSEG